MIYCRGGQSAALQRFSVARVKFCMHISAIYDAFIYENTQNLHQITSLCK